jgi:16S rRNA (guanine527-N7)-methyltransferase
MGYEEFEKILLAGFPDVPEERLEMFRKAELLYRDWNSRINVISRKDIDNLYPHHILHSLCIAEYLRRMEPSSLADFESGTSVLDLGTGGGFPGIPLAILFPNSRFTLCDSVGKKIKVASAVAEGLGLDNVTTVNARAESLAGKCDYVVTRAVAALEDFYPWVKGKYRKEVLCLKGGDVVEEIYRMQTRFGFRGGFRTWQVSGWLDDEYFKGKFVISF